MGIHRIILAICTALFLIYSLNITGFRIGNFVLVTSCVKDEPIDLIFWAVYLLSLIAFAVVPSIGKYVFFGFQLLGFFVLAMNHYRFFFKVSPKKIEGYNRFFSQTHHIIPMSDTRLVPDTFHILVFILNFVSLALATLCLLIL